MDLLKKMFGGNNTEANDKKDKGSRPDFIDEFRKPSWYDDDSDDELFDNNKTFQHFQIFTNPLEMQKHFEQQMQEIMKSMKQFDGTSDPFERNLREDYMKPGFEKCPLPDQKKAGIDRDLDGEIYAEQLHSLLQRISPEMEHFFSNKRSIKSKEAEQKMITAPQEPQRKASDEEKIWNAIHGNSNSKGGKQLNKIPKTLPERFMRIPHAGGVFEGAHQGPKLFSQSVMVQTVRKPDGSYETRRTIRDADGQTKTTVTRSMNGKTETITSYGNEQSSAHNGGTAVNDNSDIGNPMLKSMIDTNRNLAVTKGGYLLPNNLW